MLRLRQLLIIANKELRRLEMEIINALNAIGKQSLMCYSGIKLTQFYGVEIDESACKILGLQGKKRARSTNRAVRMGVTSRLESVLYWTIRIIRKALAVLLSSATP